MIKDKEYLAKLHDRSQVSINSCIPIMISVTSVREFNSIIFSIKRSQIYGIEFRSHAKKKTIVNNRH